MNILLAPSFVRAFKKVTKHNQPLRDKIKKQIEVFRNNPNHPSLRLHKLEAKNTNAWSISVSGNIRIIFQHIEDGMLFTNIGSHDEVY